MADASQAQGTRYQRLRVLGRGGMGEVFLGRQLGVEGFERLVALKRIRAEYADDPGFRELFLAEARVLAGLRHPNICQTFDLREMDGDLFMVLEYLEGMALGPVLHYYGGLDSRIVGAILVGVCAGLDHAHRAGVVHRDITPSNIYITSAGEVKIVDFGVAKVITEGTTTTGLKGKGPYMSPEQLAGEPLDGRSDVFALGAVGFEALTGECLFRRATEYLTFEAIVHGERPQREQPSPIDSVLLQCLEVDRDKRFATARDLGRAIEKA
ncbi:MAG: serine/threonine protein kinase, partial [Deltaproteobacteria bacterium]|nr:serine/threonine protein kinase [Deltaproteobacteria bacterium]